MLTVEQSISDDKFVSLMDEKVDLNFWKYQNIKELNKAIAYDKEIGLSAVNYTLDYNRFVSRYEIKWGKSRHDFNLLERDQVHNEYVNLRGG